MAKVASQETFTGIEDAMAVDASPAPAAIVQSDTTVLDPPLAGIRINAAGALKIRSTDGSEHTLAVLAAEYLPGAIDMVFATGTDIADADLMGYIRT